jgi:hypothetical protein
MVILHNARIYAQNHVEEFKAREATRTMPTKPCGAVPHDDRDHPAKKEPDTVSLHSSLLPHNSNVTDSILEDHILTEQTASH